MITRCAGRGRGTAGERRAPTAPPRRRSPRAGRPVSRSTRRSGSRRHRRPGDLVDQLAVEDRRHEAAPMPWMRCGPAWPPERTADRRARGDNRAARGSRSRRNSPTPGDRVPPVPTPATRTSTRSVERRGRSPDRWCGGGPRGWRGSRTGRAERRRGSQGHRAGRRDGLAHAAHGLGD